MAPKTGPFSGPKNGPTFWHLLEAAGATGTGSRRLRRGRVFVCQPATQCLRLHPSKARGGALTAAILVLAFVEKASHERAAGVSAMAAIKTTVILAGRSPGLVLSVTSCGK